MELKSEPKTIEVHFTDIDIAYSSGIRSFTLEDGKDRIEPQVDSFFVAFANGEKVTLFLAGMHWMSTRPRVQKRKVEEPKA